MLTLSHTNSPLQDDEVCKGIPSQLQVLCNLPANDLALKIALILPVIVVMSGVMASIGTFGNETTVFMRESMSGLNSLSYFAAKNIGNIPNILISPFVFQCIFQSFAAPRASFLTYYWVLLVSCFCGYGYVLIVQFSSQSGSHLFYFKSDWDIYSL